MERIGLLFLLLGVLTSCAPTGKVQYDSWNADFSALPPRFGQAVTALWISRYAEDSSSRQFVRSSAWGEVPEKLVPDGQGGLSAAVPLMVQSEGSEGPRPDQFDSVLVRLVRSGDGFTLAPNDDLPGEFACWTEPERRTVHLRGRVIGPGPDRVFWQFQGRY